MSGRAKGKGRRGASRRVPSNIELAVRRERQEDINLLMNPELGLRPVGVVAPLRAATVPVARMGVGQRVAPAPVPVPQRPPVYLVVPGKHGTSGLRMPTPRRPQTARRTGGWPNAVEGSGQSIRARPGKLPTARRTEGPPMTAEQRAVYWEQLGQAHVISSDSEAEAGGVAE